MRLTTLTMAAVAIAASPLLFASPLHGQLRYDREYPWSPYSAGPTHDPMGELVRRLTSGEQALSHDGTDHGYLASLLGALGIPVESQMLVFTRTSLQRTRISPKTPRAIYFDDEVYVAWVPGTATLEVAAIDPLLGSVFYTVDQAPGGAPRVQRQTALCLQCHDTYGLTGGGVPELLTGSMLPDAHGNQVFHEGWIATTHETPLRSRWGGWYVTGTHGDRTHLGNVWVENPMDAQSLDFRKTGNVTDLSTLLDPSAYPTAHSDIVALMVFEHQITVQNRIVNVSYRVRQALHEAGVEAEIASEASLPDTVRAVLVEEGEALLRALFLAGETTLETPVRGTSGFAETFEAKGPSDSEGRTLRDLDLETRLFRYPLSYLVYSDAFLGLPPVAKAYLYRRMREVLERADGDEAFAHLGADDRRDILEILEATHPGFAAG